MAGLPLCSTVHIIRPGKFEIAGDERKWGSNRDRIGWGWNGDWGKMLRGVGVDG